MPTSAIRPPDRWTMHAGASLRFRVLPVGLAVVLAMAGFGCDTAAETGGRPAGEGAGGSPLLGSAATSSASATPGAPCGVLQSTEPCVCDSGLSGRRTCQQTGFSVCECWDPETGDTNLGTAADPPENRRADIVFDWQRTEPVGGSCEAGHYLGAFAGFYSSPAAFNAPVPVASIDVPGLPGLEFWMDEADGSGEHFAISGGKVRGAANLVFPFEIDFTGSLDCPSGKAHGELLNGWYEVFGVRFMFEGTWEADYNRLTHSFINGTWEVTEFPDPNGPPPDPNFPLPESGGFGTWNANWDPSM